MKNWKLAPIALGLAAFVSTSGHALGDDHAKEMTEAELQERIAETRAAIEQFASTLQGELVAAMEEGGPTQAIEVCNQRAPEIADEIAADTGWEVGRTSLKIRNPDNSPDEWERIQLEHFQSQHAEGTPANELAPRHEVVEGEDGARFRFMAAIPTGGACLACHGSDISSDVKHALERLYPDDQATGFSEGDVRGAFSITQEM
ncbi:MULTISPECIES: DUF3365 domain-containing protein [unclassified Thioalkalivibrio]|uniref:Tll0287-like domain-containing protein n=1 Tax=unclassified Thioalkalivibrio TaxID=2621013 RepID=UPI0003A64FAE|nr:MULTISPECIES: DUF3365 domain-containing protein [unclassified Thioalkalivibrio]